jgi:hypothetical protein
MSSGFNTDARVGEKVFHVQTEDRGPTPPVIDTVIYLSGMVVHRRSSDYREFAASQAFSPEQLRLRVEQQHRNAIDDLRAGTLDAEIAASAEQAVRAGGIQVQLLNTGSWLSAGNVSLDLEIVRRADRAPEAGAQVEAMIEGAIEEKRHSGTSGGDGRVKIEFPLPPLGKNDLALVIRANAEAGKDELRFTMRSKSKAPPASPPPNSSTTSPSSPTPSSSPSGAPNPAQSSSPHSTSGASSSSAPDSSSDPSSNSAPSSLPTSSK